MQLAKRIESLSESGTIKQSSLVKALQAQGKNIINLTAGELDFGTPLYLQKAVAKKLPENKYTNTLGLPLLRQLIAKKIKKETGWQISSQNIAATAGAKTGLFALFQTIINPGDEVIIPIPAWVSYEHQIKLAGGKPIFVPLSKNYDLDIKAIKGKITKKTKAIIINSPHNPTGKIFSRPALLALNKLIKNTGIFVISDEIYNTLTYLPKKSVVKSLAEVISNKSKLIIINGFSKSEAITGWRIGYAVAAEKIISGMNKFLSHAGGNPAVPSQWAAITALKQNKSKTQTLNILAKRRILASRLLKTIPGISFYEPGGAFYFFIDVRPICRDTQKFCRLLLAKQQAALIPGEAFQAPGFIRLSFAASEKDIALGINCLKNFIANFNS
jgi:aspartate aminotransferase